MRIDAKTLFKKFKHPILAVSGPNTVYDMKLGDVFLIGSMRNTAVHPVWGTKECMTQAWFERVYGGLRYEAFSNLSLIKPRKPIWTSGRIKINVKQRYLEIEDSNARAFRDFTRVARQFSVLNRHLTQEQDRFFMNNGFLPCFSGLWLDKDNVSRRHHLAILDDGLPILREYDFSEDPVLIDPSEFMTPSEFKQKTRGSAKRDSDETLH